MTDRAVLFVAARRFAVGFLLSLGTCLWIYKLLIGA